MLTPENLRFGEMLFMLKELIPNSFRSPALLLLVLLSFWVIIPYSIPYVSLWQPKRYDLCFDFPSQFADCSDCSWHFACQLFILLLLQKKHS